MRYLLFLICIFFLFGCSKLPSDDLIDVTVRENYELPGYYEVTSVEKVNGWNEEDFYVAEVEYEVKFLLNLSDIDDAMSKSNELTALEVFAMRTFESRFRASFGDFKTGDKQLFTQKIYFKETENGWRYFKN